MKHETETRSQPATRSKAGGEAVSQQVSGRFTRSDDETPKERVVGLMKHVPNGREERKTARDGTQEPKKKNSQGRDPSTMKERAVPTAGKVVIKLFGQ